MFEPDFTGEKNRIGKETQRQERLTDQNAFFPQEKLVRLFQRQEVEKLDPRNEEQPRNKKIDTVISAFSGKKINAEKQDGADYGDGKKSLQHSGPGDTLCLKSG